MTAPSNLPLLLAATGSAIAALGHVGCILFGARWYRFFGAGESMARMAEAGNPRAAIITAGIASVLMLWALYAATAAGLTTLALPFTRAALCIITAVYLLRGLAGFAGLAKPMGRSPAFWVWSSLICLTLGGLHLVGLRQVWDRL